MLAVHRPYVPQSRTPLFKMLYTGLKMMASPCLEGEVHEDEVYPTRKLYTFEDSVQTI